VFAAGVTCLAFTGGLAGAAGQGHAGQGRGLLLLGGLVAVIAGIVLLAPLAVSVLAAGASPRLPVAVRIALRDLVRYRARSGAALAATRSCSSSTGSRPARSLPAPTSAPCGQGWQACRTWR